MKMLKPIFYATSLLSLLTAPSFAREGMKNDDMTQMHHATGGAFDGAMMKMHRDMGKAEVTGDTDTDFVQGMIPHHQGAVDMAKIELEKGHDPALRKLARDIVASQEKEIAMMKKWLATHKTARP